MLSRVANSLYWMSRYVERAENTARMVDVNLQLLLDVRDLEDASLEGYWGPIVQSMGDGESFQALHGKATGRTVTEFLVFQEENPNSILSAITLGRENARTVRDQITIELWEELNRLYLFLHSDEAKTLWMRSPSDFFQKVKRSSLLIQGITDTTVVRNEGWYFIEAGRQLERADKTSRLLDLRYGSTSVNGHGTQWDALSWSAILRSCSAWDAYKAQRGADLQPGMVAEFLLLSEDFPRSARFCVQQLDKALRRISGVPEGRFTNDAERLCGRLLAQLQFSTKDEIMTRGLHATIDDLQVQLNAIGGALFQSYIAQDFFPHAEDEIRQQEEQQQQTGTKIGAS